MSDKSSHEVRLLFAHLDQESGPSDRVFGRESDCLLRMSACYALKGVPNKGGAAAQKDAVNFSEFQ
jgi:hypothetical protein